MFVNAGYAGIGLMALLSLLQMGWLSMLIGIVMTLVFGVAGIFLVKPRNHVWRIFMAAGFGAGALILLYGYLVYEGYQIYQGGIDVQGLLTVVTTHWLLHLAINVFITLWLAWHTVVGILRRSDGL